jgi:predicted regulator of Ras-like GTPase activity (Roadblock/LC7/MglB family)
MDHAEAWKRFLSECPEIAGGAYFHVDGERISSANFGDAKASCAAAATIARQLFQDIDGDEFEALILEGEHGYIIVMPVLDKAILAALVDKQAKLGLALLDIQRAIDDTFGPGLAAEPVAPPLPPKYDKAHAKPNDA